MSSPQITMMWGFLPSDLGAAAPVLASGVGWVACEIGYLDFAMWTSIGGASASLASGAASGGFWVDAQLMVLSAKVAPTHMRSGFELIDSKLPVKVGGFGKREGRRHHNGPATAKRCGAYVNDEK